MRKVKFAFLFVLVLCIAAATFVACNPTDSGGTGTPTIPVQPDVTPPDSQGFVSVSGGDAWDMFIDAARESNSDTGHFVYSDVVIGLDYAKDALGYSYALKVQSDIDLNNDANSQILLELWKADGDGTLVEMLLGLYYFDSTVVYDCTGLKSGATVVKTDDLNLTAVVKTLRELLTSGEEGEYKSLAQFILNDLLTMDEGLAGSIISLIPNLLGSSRLETASDGTQRLIMPIGLSDLLGGVLGGLLTPGPDSLIPADVYDMVEDLLGIDLKLLSTIKGLNVYIVADLTADDRDGKRELDSVDVQIGVDFDTVGSSLEEIYGTQQSHIDISVGGDGIQWNNDKPNLDVRSYLTSAKAPEGSPESDGGRGLTNIDELQDYSLLTVDLTVSLDMVLKEYSISPSQLIAAFGTLIKLPEETVKQLGDFLNKQININGLDRTLQIHISGGIDMFDNSGTNLLIELTGADKYNDVRASIAYVGAEEALFVDLTGILGTGKVYITDINVNDLLGGLIDQLIGTIRDAIKEAGLIDENKEVVDDFVTTARELIANGDVIRTVGTSADGEPIADTLGLVKAIIENIDVDMAENIFNLKQVQITLTQEILDYIFYKLIFVDANTGEPTGEKIPIAGDVVLELTDNGFASSKDITIDLDLAAETGEDNVLQNFASLGVGISARFGSVENENYFDNKIAAIKADRQNGKYIKLLSFDMLKDEDGNISFGIFKDAAGNFTLDNLPLDEILAGIDSVEVGLQADILLDVKGGEFADIVYDGSEDFLLSILAAFEESFGTEATLTLRAEVTDIVGLIEVINGLPEGADIGAVLPSLLPMLNIYIELAEKGADASAAPLRAWLVNGVLHLATSEDLGGLALMVDIKPFLGEAGTTSDAISVEGTDDDGIDIMGILLPLLAADDTELALGDLYVDVAIGSIMLSQVLSLLNLEGVTITDASGEDFGLDVGVSITLSDGLHIAGGDTSEGLSVGAAIGFGENFDLGLTLGGINAVINGESNIKVPEDIEFVDFLNEPYVNIGLTLGIEGDLHQSSISLGEGVGEILFPEGVGVDVALSVAGKLDLGTILAELMGTDAPERENRTELAVSIVNNLTDGDPEVLLAAYYRDGILYVDASALIGARVSVEIDLMGIVADLLKHEHVDANNDGKCDECEEAMPEAGTSAISAAGEGEGIAPKNEKTKLDLLLYISSKGVMIELAQTAAKAIASAIGIDDIGEIGAALSLNWSNLTNPDGDLLTAEATIGDLADVMVSLSSLSIGIGAGIYDEDVPSVIPSYVNLDNFSNIGKLALAEGADGETTLDTSELALDNIYAEISGSISLGAIEDGGSDKWEVGTWIDNFTSGSDTIKEDVKSLIKRLVIAFALDNNVSTQLDFTLRALIRLPEELDVSDTSALVLDILGMSDIALEITSPGRDLLSVYVISGGDGTSTLYIASDAEGIIGGKIAVPGINIAELFASGEGDQAKDNPTPAPEEPTEASALVAADPTEEHTCADPDGDGKCDECGKTMPNILDTILSVISSIMMTDEELKVGFGANFIGALLSALLPGGYELNAENFVQLDPNNSYLSLFYGKGEGDQRDIRIDLALAADPAMIGLSLFGIKAAVNDADATVVPEGVDLGEFKSIFAEDGAISLSAAIGLDLELKGTDSLPDGELPVGDMLSAFIGNLALNLGLKIEENISLGVEISVQGNIYFDSEEKTELAVEIKDSIGDTLILGAYLRGKALYVDMGIISEHNFVFEETGIVAMVLQAVKDLLQGEGDAPSLSEATTAAGDAEEEALVDALEIVMELSSGHIALHVTEAVLLGLLGAVGGEVDIAGIFGALDLGAVADVDIDFEDPSIVVSADTNYASLKLSVTDILISNIFDGETGGNTLTGYIDGVIESGNFQSYSASSKARFDIALSVEYSADAYYTEIKGGEIDAYPLADRYSKLPDGTFVQDNNGTYVREGKSLSDIVDALLEMPALKNALDGALSGQSATLKDLVNMLIASLGIELYIDDPIGDSLDINITGILDLEALKISELLQSFNKEWLDLKDNATKVAILEALDLCIEIVFNPEDGPASAYIALYLIDGYLYIDLSGLGGPKISANLFGLLEKIEFDGNPFYTGPADGSAEGEAVTAATAEAHECYDDNGDGKCDYPGCGKLYASDMVGGVLNALIRAIVLRTNLDAALEGNGNIFEDGLGIDVMLPANMLGAVVALITGAEEDYVFEDFVLNSDESKISLNVGGGNGIELAVSATTDAGFNLSVAMNAGIGIDVATADDSVMTSGEMKTYLDMTELVNTVIGLINGGEEGDAPDGFGSQQITLSISGKAEFSSKSEGSYDVGSLLQQYIEDLILEINTENTFEDGIAFRLTVSADLGKIGFGALTNGKLDDDQKLDAFLKSTDLTAIEAALELLDRDEAGNITDDVLAGIYLSKGNLYLDGTGVFDIVDNYSYVANFLTFVIEAVNMSKCSCGNFADDDTNGECDNCGGTQPIDCYCGNYADADENRICDNCGGYDPYCHCEEFVDKDNEGKGNGRCDNCNNLPPDAVSQAYAAVAAARAQALTAAEGDDEMRDAIAEIVYSDTAMQIVITKSVISALLAALMPDLGSLADIFDSFEVSLGAEIGKYDYVSIYDADLYKKEGDVYVKITDTDPVDGTYYVLTADGEYIEAQPRYDLYETAEYALNENGTGTYVRLASDSSVILDRDRYTFYYQAEGGNYIGITDLSEIGKDGKNVDVYVIRGGSYCAIERDGETGKVNTYDRRYGYVRNANGKLLRVYNPHTDLDEFYLILGAEVGTMNANLAIGGIQLEFGRTDSIIPDYITAGKTKAPEAYNSAVHGDRDAYTYENGIYTKVEAPEEDKKYYYDVPLLPFYDSVITVGASVELELAITEGEVDIGQIFAGILGDLEGMVIQIPDTSKGYSSAHLRLDLTLVLDMFNLPGSEIEIELYNLSSESGAEVRWLAAYYMNDMIYLDLSFFGLPRLAVPMTEISTLIEDLLSDLLNTSIYDNVEIGTGASEAITADDTANADADEAADMSLEDKVASLLISKRKLSVVLGNGIMRWLLSVITIGDMPLNDLVYEELQGNMNVTIDISDGIDVSLGAELRLEGDRYELHEDVAIYPETDRFYVFTERGEDDDEKREEGLFVLDEEEGAFREASDAEINAGELTLYVRHKAVKGADGWTYYTYTKAVEGGGTHYYDAATDSYVAVSEGNPAGKTYNVTEAANDGLPVYRYVSGADANPNDYDTVLDLYVGVNNIDLFFTEEREFTMDRDYLETFHDFNSLDTVSLSETISLELLFSALDIDAIDLSALLEYLFPDSELDFDAVLSAVTGSDSATEILRRLNLTVSLEFKLGAFLNYLRSLAATYDLSYEEEEGLPRVALESLTGDIDLITFINTIRSLIGAKKVPAADGSIYYTDPNVDDLIGLEDFLNFINASVELTTVSGDGVPEHTMLGVYLSLGSNEGEKYEADQHEGQNRYSNYFASEDGKYGYVEGTGYVAIDKITDYDEEVHGSYSRDDSFLYPDVNGDRVRADAGLYVNLSYFGQPGVYMNLSELMAFIGGMMGEKIGIGDLIPGASEAITASGEDGTADEGGLSLPIDLGELLGGGIDIELPLLTQQISSYIKAFVYGVRITSTYIRILVQTDYLNQLLDILLAPDGSPFDPNLEFNQSYLGINVDVNNYLYAPLNERADGSDADEIYYYDAEKDDYLLVGSDTPANADRYAGTQASGAELPKYTYIAESGSYKEFVEDKAYFVFIEFAGDTVSAPEEGLFVLDGERVYRKATEAELNPPETTEPVEELTFYARYAAKFVDGVWVYYAYTAVAEGGTHFYDAATDSYVAVSEGNPAPENATLYTESEIAVGGLLVYGYVEADVNYVIAASGEFYVFTLFSGTSAPEEGLFVLDATGDYRKATAADSGAELYVRHKAQYDGGAWTYYTYDSIDTILGATFEQIDFADTRFTIERDDTDGMYYVYTDTLTGESYLRLRDDMTDEEEAAYNVTELGYWNITPIETYLNVNGNYVLSSEASNTDWVQAERFDSAMAAEFGNAALEGTFVFYVNNGESSYAVLGQSGSDIDLKDVWVVYPSENTKPFIEARVWLWGHSLSLGINMPETAAQDYTYTDVGERNGDYVMNEKFIYVPAVIGADTADGEVYLYYRGEYYAITEGALRNADGSAGVDWNDFVANPYAYNLRVEVQAESFSANVPVTAADVYARDYYGYTYTYVGEDNGNFVRDGSTSLVSVPEFHADFNAPSDSYVYGDDTADYYVDALGNLTTDAPDNYDGTVYKRDDFTFVHSTATGRFTSVADAKAIFEESGVGGDFEAWLAANYDTDEDGVVYYDGEYIKYGDTGELYAINLTIRGSISLGQHMTYYTEEQWKEAGLGALPETKYVLVRGEYVEFEPGNLAHEKLTKYYAYADSSSSMNKVLGAILGDMDALFTVSDGYKAVLPFEIRATVKIDYRNETDYDSLYVAGLELAIDVWRTEATDDTLTHVLGLYYMSDVWNIGDNNDANDIINSAALYADLSWILGPSAKFKIDLSDYPLETLLNDKVNLGELFGGGGSSEALTAAEGEDADVGPDVGNPDVATVLLNVFSRKIALQASAGFLKLIVGLVAPNTAATLEEMLPNISIGVDINAAPYDITIGATLFDEEGKGLLDLGITLNLFGTEDKTTGMQIDFGSIEDYDTLSAARFDAVSSEYMFYHALFSRVDEDYITANADETYYIRDPEGGKEYIKVENAAERVADGERVFVFDDDESYQAFNSAQARDSWDKYGRYALIPEGYIRLEDKADYDLATGKDENYPTSLQLYVYSHNFTTGADSMVGITTIGAEDIDANTIGEDGTKQVYVAKPADNRFGDRDASGGYVLDANGAYKKVKGFGSYQTLLGLNLNDLISGLSGGGNVDIMGMLIGGIADSGLESIEIGGSLSLDIEFKDVLNWTRQMSRLMAVGGSESNYFSMLLSSMAMNSAEFVSKIGLDIDLAVRLEVANLLGMLPSLMGGGEPDIMSLLPAILPGAQIYLEIAIDTNFYGEDIEGAAPIQLWVEVTDEMMLDIYITAPDLGRVTDIARYNDDGTVDPTIGDFFAQGIKIVDLISLGDLLARGASADEPLARSEATIAAEEEGGGLIIDIGDANVGIVPENIWGILDLLLGQVLFANDMLSVGLTETILAGLIEAMVPEFPKEDLELLPTFKITSGSDTTGINLLFGDGSLGVQVQLGIQGGFDDFATIEEATTALKDLIGAENSNIYGIDSYDAYFAKIAYLKAETDGDDTVYTPVEGTSAVNAGGNAVVISTETHALAAYASPNEAWLGDRYELVDFDEDGHPVFGSWDRDENGNFETDADGARTYAYTLAPVDKGVAYNNAFTLNKNGTGLYGKMTGSAYDDYQGVAGGQVTEANADGKYYVGYDGVYMLISRIEKLTGQDYTGTTYDFDEDKVTGEYVLLGDVYVTIELDDLSLALNKPFSAPDEAVKLVGEDGKPLKKSNFKNITELGIRLQTSLDIGFWGETGASINLGELADLILGIEALKTLLGGTQFVGSDLGITVGGDIGDKEKAYYTVNLDAYFKFDGTLQVKLDVIDNHLGLEKPPTILSVILEDDTLYADLSGVLGAGVKGKITELGLEDTLLSALVGAGIVEPSAEATTAAIDDTYGMTLHDYAYIAAAINPGYFSLQLTLAAVQAILAKVSADSPDLAVDVELPDLGDIRIESYGDRADGNLLSLSVKMSEAFGVSMDVKHLYIGTEPISNPVENAAEYKQLFDVASGELNPDLTISLSANASLAMTSKGLKPGDDGYDDSLAGWAIGLLTNLLGANSFFVSAYDISDTEYNKYGGPIYTKDEEKDTYKLFGTLVKSTDGTFQGYYDAEGNLVETLPEGQYYRTTMIEATFAESEVNISIELEADLNLGALISYGIGGILLSDLRLAVKLGSPFTDNGADTTVLEVYYLGSSRLSPEASGSIYTMRKAVNDGTLEAFSDAIYIDASGLGLGKIKFQGIAGLLGANIGQIYDDATAPAVSAAEGDTTEGDTTEGDTAEDGTETAGSGSTVSVDLAIDIAENYIGLTVDRSLIEMIFGMIDLGNFTLPQIQNLGLGLTFGENGLSSVALSSTVDPAGTGLHLTLGVPRQEP